MFVLVGAFTLMTVTVFAGTGSRTYGAPVQTEGVFGLLQQLVRWKAIVRRNIETALDCCWLNEIDILNKRERIYFHVIIILINPKSKSMLEKTRMKCRKRFSENFIMQGKLLRQEINENFARTHPHSTPVRKGMLIFDIKDIEITITICFTKLALLDNHTVTVHYITISTSESISRDVVVKSFLNRSFWISS